MASSSKAIIQWAGGILATVISSVVIYHFTRPPDPPTLPISIEGRVIDVSSSTLISDANVTLRADKFRGTQRTDKFGRYCFEIEGLPGTTAATFEIEAPGYKAYAVNATLTRLSDAEDNELLPMPSKPAGAPNPPGHLGAVGGKVVPDPAKFPVTAAKVSLSAYARRPEFVRIGPH
jgi:hypothetical protein